MATFDILNGYWVAGTNPTTQVFSSVAGVEDFVANNDANYQTWLGAGNFGTLLQITAESAGSAGTVRCTLADTSLLQTGQRGFFQGLTGSPLANTFAQFNVIDATHVDIVGSTFVAAASPVNASLAMAAIVATDAALWAIFDGYAQQAWQPSSLAISSAVDVTLTNRLASSIYASYSVVNKKLILPKMRTPRAIPKGTTFRIINTAPSVNLLQIYKADGATLIGYLNIGDALDLQLTDNSTNNGTFSFASNATGFAGGAGQLVRGLVGDTVGFGANIIQVSMYECVMLDANNNVKRVFGNSIQANVTTAGPAAGGRDQAAAFAATQEVSFFAIWGPGAALAGILSANTGSAGPAALPAGYTHWCYCGSAKLVAGAFPAMAIVGDTFTFLTAKALLAAGAATAETAVSTTLTVPSMAKSVQLQVNATISAGAPTLTLRLYTGVNFITFPIAVQCCLDIPQVNNNFYYLWSGATGAATINALSYTVPNGG